MRPCLARIEWEEKRRWLLLPSSTFTLGGTAGSDLLVNHPFLDGRIIKVASGRFPSPEGGPDGRKGARKGRSLAGDSLKIDLWPLPLLVPAALLLSFSLLVAAGALKGREGPEPLPSQDWAPVALPALDPLGNCAADRSHPEGIRFAFRQLPGSRARLAFFLGGVDEGEVRLLLDGAPLAGPFPLPSGWGEERMVDLPCGDGSDGAPRVLEFLLRWGSPGPPSWCVRGVRIAPLDSPVRAPGGEPGFPPGPAVQGGKELARRYQSLSPSSREERRQVEGEMARALASDLIRLRSLVAAGRSAEAEGLRTAIREWVPVSWEEGQRLLHRRGGS